MTATFQRNFSLNSEVRDSSFLIFGRSARFTAQRIKSKPKGQGSLASEHIQKLRYSMKSRERYREKHRLGNAAQERVLQE